MPKTALLIATIVVLISAAAYSADNETNKQVSSVAPAQNLVTAADEKVASIEKSLTDPEGFDKAKKNLKRDAGILAVLAQAIAEHDQQTPWQLSAPDLRDVALQLAAADSHGQAVQLLETAKNAQGGEPKGAEKQANWNKLIDFDSLMDEIKLRNSTVGRAARKMRRGLSEDEREEVARDLEILALTGLVVGADTHEVKNNSDIPKWKQFAAEQRMGAVETAVAFRKNDGNAVKASYAKLKKSCSGCHKAFRK